MNNTDTGTHFKDAHKIAFKIRTYYRTKLSTLTNKLTYMHNAHAHDQHSRTCEHFPLLAAALIMVQNPTSVNTNSDDLSGFVPI